MVEITWNKNIQPANKAEIEKYLSPVSWLVPGWVECINVNLWDSEAADERISINVHYDYRFCSLNFCSNWLVETETNKASQVIHELLHIHLSLIADYARDKINLLCPKEDAEKFNKSLIQELTTRHESATSDLAKVICDKLNTQAAFAESIKAQ